MNGTLLLQRAAVAITGGIAAGKSRVAALLAELSKAGRLDADTVCRDLLRPGGAGWQALRQAIDPDFFRPAGELDRPSFRRRLFADAALRAQVNGLLHPLAREAIRHEAETMLASGGCDRLLVEVPLLFEAGWQEDYRRVVVVVAEAEVSIDRLMRRDGVSRQEALAALASQMPLAEKARLADHVIDNSGDWESTRRQVTVLLPQLWQMTEKKS